MNRYSWLLGLLTLLAAACQAPPQPEVREHLIMQNGFETMSSFLPDSLLPELTQKKVHSGRYAVYLDSAHEYTTSYRVRMGRVFNTKPRKLRLSVWAWVPDFEDDAMMVLAVSAPDDPNRIIYSKGIYLADKGPYREWQQLSRMFDLPGEISSNSYISIYAWRAGAKRPIYLDDWALFEIR